MNQKYYISDSGKLIVLDEKNNSKEIEKSGKYKEKLIQENIVEKIENRIEELEDVLKKQSIEEVSKKNFIPFATIIAIISSLIVIFSNCILVIILTNLTVNILAFFNLLCESFFLTFPFVGLISLLGVIIDIARNSDYNEHIKKISADNLELEILRKILSKEIEKLNKLNQNKTKHRLSAKYEFNKLYSIDDQQQLNNLNECIKNYRRLGRSLPILYEAYKKNTLNKLLQEYGFNLSKEEYGILVDYIKEKENILVPRKKKIKKQI